MRQASPSEAGLGGSGAERGGGGGVGGVGLGLGFRGTPKPVALHPDLPLPPTGLPYEEGLGCGVSGFGFRV